MLIGSVLAQWRTDGQTECCESNSRLFLFLDLNVGKLDTGRFSFGIPPNHEEPFHVSSDAIINKRRFIAHSSDNR